MELKIGEIFEHNGEWYQCVEEIACYRCSFYDKNKVILKKLEKVGEPFPFNDTILQTLKSIDEQTCEYCIFKDKACEFDSCEKGTFLVKFKQTKEDMNKKKLNLEKLTKKMNLKPFDLEAAKAGKPVCTRDGRKARIMSFDRKSLLGGKKYLIVALVEDDTKEEEIMYSYNEKGKVLVESDMIYEEDLMMLPEKKEGWINIYKDNDMVYCIYKTKEEAIKNKSIGDGYITTIKIDWEE